MLRVGFVPGVTPDRWARRWRERETEPLELVPLEEADQRAALLDQRVDLCLVRLPLDREDLHLVRLYDEVRVVVVPADHLISAVDEVELADLVDEQLAWGDVPDWASVARVDQLPFPAMTVAEAVEVVAAGTGVAVMPMSVARLHHRKDVVHRPVVDLPETTVGVAWRVEDDRESVAAFVGVVRGRTANSSRGTPAPPAPGKAPGKAATPAAKPSRSRTRVPQRRSPAPRRRRGR